MEISGKIYKVLGKRTGVSPRSGKSWMTQTYVLEVPGDYPKRFPFEIFGEEKINQYGLHEGMLVTIYFDIEGSEYQGKWYSKIKAFAVRKEGVANTQPAQAPASSPAPNPSSSDAKTATGNAQGEDDLPF